jgi:endoglucanase
LKAQKVNASFFLTGNFYRNRAFRSLVQKLKSAGHYLGAHSDQHLLYCDWTKRDSLLVTKKQFRDDLEANYTEMKKFGIERSGTRYFLPPFEWYNDSISNWTTQMGLQLINFSPGTISHADYTTPEMRNYRSSDKIFESILSYEKEKKLNGFILLVHIGTDPKRTDKFYLKLGALIEYLKNRGYQMVKIDALLE